VEANHFGSLICDGVWALTMISGEIVYVLYPFFWSPLILRGRCLCLLWTICFCSLFLFFLYFPIFLSVSCPRDLFFFFLEGDGPLCFLFPRFAFHTSTSSFPPRSKRFNPVVSSVGPFSSHLALPDFRSECVFPLPSSAPPLHHQGCAVNLQASVFVSDRSSTHFNTPKQPN